MKLIYCSACKWQFPRDATGFDEPPKCPLCSHAPLTVVDDTDDMVKAHATERGMKVHLLGTKHHGAA